jgi:hypothetical protein
MMRGLSAPSREAGRGPQHGDCSALALLLAFVILATAGAATPRALDGDRLSTAAAVGDRVTSRAMRACAVREGCPGTPAVGAAAAAKDRPRWRDVAALGLPPARAPTPARA